MTTAEPAVVEFRAGSCEDIVVELTDSSDPPAPVADLVGWTAKAQARYAHGHPMVLVEWSTGGTNPIELVDSTAVLKVTSTLAEQSVDWTWRLAWLDLVLTAPDQLGGVVNRPARVILRVIPAITR